MEGNDEENQRLNATNYPKGWEIEKGKEQKWFTGRVKKSVQKMYTLYTRYFWSDAIYNYWIYVKAKKNVLKKFIKKLKRTKI